MSVNAFTLFGELKAETNQFQRTLRDSHNQLEQTSRAIDKTESKAKSLGQTSATTARGFEKLREKVSETRDRLNTTADAFSRGDAKASQMRSALVAAERASASLNSRLKDSAAKLADFAANAGNLKEKLQTVANGIKSAGQTLTAALTLPIAGAGAAVLKVGVGYESALNNFQAVTNATAADMARAGETAKALGADITLPATSAKDAALAMLELGKAGMSVNEAMAASKGVLQLAAAGQLEEARAAEITANALNSFNLKATESVRVADLLAAAANASSAGVGDIAESMAQASASFAAAKVPIEDLTAGIAVLANAGIKGSDAGTSLKTFLSSIQAPSKKGADAMADLGVKVFDTQGKFKGLPTVIDDFSKAMAGMTDEAKTNAIQDIFGSDASRAAQILFRDGADGFNKIKEAVTQLGAAANLATSLTKGLGGAWQAFGSQLETIGITIFEAIKTPLTNLLQTATQFTSRFGDAFAQLSPNLQTASIAIAGMVAAAGPLLIIAGTLASSIMTLGTALTALTGAASVGAALSAIAPIALAVGAALGALAAEAYLIYAAWSTNFGNIRSIFDGFKNAAIAAFNDVASVLKPAADQISRDAVSGFNQIKTWWQTDGKEISKAAETIFTNTLRGLLTALDAMRALWRTHGEDIKTVASAAWSVIKTVIGGAISNIGNVIKLVAQVVNSDWKGAWETAKTIVVNTFSGIIRYLGSMHAGMVGAVKAMVAGVWNLQGWMLSEGMKLGQAVWQGMANGVKNGASALYSAVTNLAQNAIAAAKEKLDIHSPSRVFHAIGKDTAQGFIDGISALKGGAQAAMASLLDVSGLKLGKTDKAGVELLTSLSNEIARNNVQTKTQEVLLDLTAGKYGKLNQAIKDRILLAAGEIDALKATQKATEDLKSGFDKLDSIMSAFAEKSGLQKLNEQLADESVTRAITERAKALNISAEAYKANLQLLQMQKDENGVAPNSGVSMRSPRAEGETVGTGIPIPLMPPEIFEQPPRLKAAWEDFFGTFFERTAAMRESIGSVNQVIGESLLDSIYRVGDVFSNAIQNWDGTVSGFFKSIASGFADMAKQIIADLVRILIYKAVFKLIGAFAGGISFGGGGGGADLGSSALNGLGGGGGFSADFATGGFTGLGGKFQPAGIVHKGEFVFDQEATRFWGLGNLSKMLNRQMPSFAGGGYVGGSASAFAANSSATSNKTQIINISFNLPNVRNPQEFRQSEKQIANGILKTLQGADNG